MIISAKSYIVLKTVKTRIKLKTLTLNDFYIESSKKIPSAGSVEPMKLRSIVLLPLTSYPEDAPVNYTAIFFATASMLTQIPLSANDEMILDRFQMLSSVQKVRNIRTDIEISYRTQLESLATLAANCGDPRLINISCTQLNSYLSQVCTYTQTYALDFSLGLYNDLVNKKLPLDIDLLKQFESYSAINTVMQAETAKRHIKPSYSIMMGIPPSEPISMLPRKKQSLPNLHELAASQGMQL